MLRVLYPGSFDPPTYGHLNIVERVSGLFDEVHVVIANNIQKRYTFSAEERFGMIEALTKAHTNVQVHTWDRLIVDFAKRIGVRIMIRGVRALADFDYEFELSMLNKGLNESIETMLIPTDPRYFVLRSSAIRELCRLGGDISTMVPPMVEEALRRRIHGDDPSADV